MMNKAETISEERRRHKRVIRPLNIRFCSDQENPSKWDLPSIVKNISAGGLSFIAPVDLKDKVLNLEIMSPLLSPRTLKIKAIVLESKPSDNASFFDIRAQFLDISEENKLDLSILEKD